MSQACISDGQSVILIRNPDSPNTLKMKELNEKQFECIAVIDPATGKIDGEKPEPHFQSPQCPADAERVRAMHARASKGDCMRLCKQEMRANRMQGARGASHRCTLHCEAL